MWLRLQLDENDASSVLGLVVAENGDIFFRATDVLLLLGFDKDPWKRLKKFLPKSRPVTHVIPDGIPIPYPNMGVVTYEEMINAVAKFTSSLCKSSSRRTKNYQLLERLVRVFRERVKVVPVRGTDLPNYATNPTKASTFAITQDERNDMDLKTLLDYVRKKFLEMYRRLRTVSPWTQRECVTLDDEEPRLVIDEGMLDDDAESRLVVDEREIDPLDDKKSSSGVHERLGSVESDESVMKIFVDSQPPAVIEWFDGKSTYTFRCTKFCSGRGDEKISLYRNENVVENQVV